MKLFKPTLLELVRWVKEQDYVFYHAPMDIEPVRVEVTWVKISHKNTQATTIGIRTRETGHLTFKLLEHLDRFRLPVARENNGETTT